MRNLISIVIGIVALILAVPAFIPFLGWANWVVVPIALVGLAIGATAPSKAGRNLNIIVIVIAIVRLMIGGGIV